MPTPCLCMGGISVLGLTYNGPAGGTVNVWTDATHHDSQHLLGTWANLNPGDSITVRSDVLTLDKLPGNTYFELVGSSQVALKTDCGVYVRGLTFSNYTVFGYRDKEGNL